MTEPALLERRLRRVLTCYPRPFRREHEEEILAVLMAGVEDGRWRAGWAASADLIRAAASLWLRGGTPRVPGRMLAATRLMYVGALVELGTLITIVASLSSMRSAIVRSDSQYTAAQWHAEVYGQVLPLAAGAAVSIGVWVWLARASLRGRGWARPAFAAFFAVLTVSLINGIAHDAAAYAPADLTAGVLLWLVALLTVALLFSGPTASNDTRSRA
jgi:hypothetical protein